MRLSLMLACTLLAVGFAGCSEGGDDDPEPSASTSASRSGSGSQSGSSTGNRTDQPPTATLGTSTSGGALPLLVNFTLNGTDPDGDAVSWTLTFGDNTTTAKGTALPATVGHNYTAAGVYNATLTVRANGRNATAVQQVNVTGGATTAGQTASMVWDVGITDQAGQTAGPPYLTCEDGPNRTFNYDSFELDVTTIGQPFRATISDASGGAAIASWKLYFNLEDCSAFAQVFTASGDAAIEGVVPEQSSPFVFAMASGGFLLEVEYQSGSQIAPA